MQLRFTDSNHIRFSDAVEKLGDVKEAHSVFRRAINHTGDKARTVTFRSLAKQVGVPVGGMKKSRTVIAERANYRRLTYTLKSTGRHLSLKEFRPTQFKVGVKAGPWGDRKTFGGTFMFAGSRSSGKFVGGGHVFKRTSGASFPIKPLWGPSVPKEMIKGATVDAFQSVAVDLGPRLAHELRRMTKGVVG